MADPSLLALLPDWIAYSRLAIAPPVAFAASFLGIWTGARLLLFRRSRLPTLHWSEVARRTHPVRVATGLVMCWAAVFFGFFYAAAAGPLNGVAPVVVGWTAALASIAGGTLASRAVHRATTGEEISWLRHARSQLVTTLFACPQLLVVVWLLATVGREPGPAAVVCALFGAAALALTAWHSGLPMARLLGAVREPAPEIVRMVRDVADEMGARLTSVAEVDVDTANAFALPTSGQVVLTTRCATELSEEALRGVVAHEVGHLLQPTAITWGRVARVIAFLPLGLLNPIGHYLGTPGVVGVYVLFFGVIWTTTRLGRRAETHADEVARTTGAPETYARTLEQIHRINWSPAVMWSWSSHPSLYDRMQSAGVQPDFPRPRPPSLTALWCGGPLAAALVVAVVFLLYLLPLIASRLDPDPERSVLAEIAVQGARPAPLFRLATLRMEAGLDTEALGLVDAALERSPHHHAYLSARAMLLARSGSCADARAALDASSGRASESHRPSCRWLRRAGEAVKACQPSEIAGLAGA